MHRKLLAMLFAMAVVVAACGGSDDDSDDSADTDSSTAETEEAEEAPEDDDDATETDDDATETDDEDESTDEEPAGPEAVSATIGLSTLAPIAALELSIDGFEEQIATCPADIEVIERNAEGDIPTLTSIVEGFLADDVDLIVTVTTPAAQAAYQVVGNAGGTTPVVFSVVTDPFAAGLATDASTHDEWITGSQSLPPFAEVMDAVEEIVPDISSIGTIYNPSESNSQTVIDALQAIADERSLNLEIATVSDSAEVGQAAESLASNGVEAFIVPTDTTVTSGIAAWTQVADDSDIPLIGTDRNQAFEGAALGIGTDYFGAGVRSAEIACAVLTEGASPADFDVINIESLGIGYNPEAAEAQSADIPQDLIDAAEVAG